MEKEGLAEGCFAVLPIRGERFKCGVCGKEFVFSTTEPRAFQLICSCCGIDGPVKQPKDWEYPETFDEFA